MDKFSAYGSWPGRVPPGIQARDTSRDIPPLAPPPQAADMQRVVQVASPELVPPVGSINVSRLVQASTVGAGDTQALATFLVPDNAIMIIRAVDFFIDDLVQATQVFFTCFENDVPVPGYDNFEIFPGVAARANTTLDQSVIRLHPSALFRISSLNTDGGAHLVGAGFQGYHMPVETYRQYGGQPF